MANRSLLVVPIAFTSATALSNPYIEGNGGEGGGFFTGIVAIGAFYVAIDAWDDIQGGRSIGWAKAAAVVGAIYAIIFYGIYIELLGFACLVIFMATSFLYKKKPISHHQQPSHQTAREVQFSEAVSQPELPNSLIEIAPPLVNRPSREDGFPAISTLDTLFEWRRNLVASGRSLQLLPDDDELIRLADAHPLTVEDVRELIRTELSISDARAIVQLISAKK